MVPPLSVKLGGGFQREKRRQRQKITAEEVANFWTKGLLLDLILLVDFF
jgi:hypothetical protein